MKNTYRAKLSFNKEEVYKERMVMDGAGGLICVPKDEAHLNKIRDSMGFFGGSNNMNTFYPGFSNKDLLPKPEDFVEFPFRLLSATIVAGGSWRSTDFSNEGMLKASTEKLVGKPVYPNHDSDDIVNNLGLIKSTKWTEGFTDSKGQKIPAGIDGIMSLDLKSNPKVVRGVLTGSIFSNSVTVDFEFEPSHKYENYQDFLEAVGTVHKDGKMVTRKATKIIDYYESSLVWLGADPYAKAINEKGELVNVDSSSVVSFSKLPQSVKDDYETSKKYFVNACFSKNNSLSLAEQYEIDLNKRTSEDTNMKFQAYLLKKLNLSADTELTEEMLDKSFAVLKEGEVLVAQATLDATTQEISTLKESNKAVTTLTEEVTTLKKEAGEVKEFVELGKSTLTAKRDEVKRLYSLSVDNKPDASVIATFEAAAPAALEGFLQLYGKSLVSKFTGTCKSCKSTDISFQSSETGDKPGTEEKVAEISATSVEDIRDKYKNKNN